MIILKSCPVCESLSIPEFQVISSGDLIVEIVPGVKVVGRIITRYCTCRNCHLIFQNPRLSDEELDKFYNKGHYRRIVNPPVGGMDAGELNRAKIDAKVIKDHIGKVSSHLDIGCSRGYLLDEVDANIKAGVEPNIDYVKVKGVKVYRKMNQVPLKSFDLVTAIHVLEHVSKPLDYLQSMVKFISKNGYLVIEVPSWDTPGGPLGFAHLSHFETDVLKLMCIQVGLEVVDVEFTPHLMLICQVNRN